jgi:hypothetical protein
MSSSTLYACIFSDLVPALPFGEESGSACGWPGPMGHREQRAPGADLATCTNRVAEWHATVPGPCPWTIMPCLSPPPSDPSARARLGRSTGASRRRLCPVLFAVLKARVRARCGAVSAPRAEECAPARRPAGGVCTDRARTLRHIRHRHVGVRRRLGGRCGTASEYHRSREQSYRRS